MIVNCFVNCRHNKNTDLANDCRQVWCGNQQRFASCKRPPLALFLLFFREFVVKAVWYHRRNNCPASLESYTDCSGHSFTIEFEQSRQSEDTPTFRQHGDGDDAANLFPQPIFFTDSVHDLA